jgi:hypothetical protein
MAVGVTTFIERTLANGTRPPSGGFVSNSFAKDGLRVGRETDMAVRRAFTKTLTLNSGIKKHAKAIEFFRVMAAANLTVCGVQKATAIVALNLRTTIDCMAKDKCNNDVVVELKTTQHNMATHANNYHKVCAKKKTLRNGLPNCLFYRHQLQAAFGMLATAAPKGVVVVICSDGGVIYEVIKAVLKFDLFVGAVPEVSKLRAPTIPWPADDAPLSAMRTYTRVVRRNPTIVAGKFGEAIVLVVHKHKTYNTSRIAKNHIKVVKELARRHQAAGIIVWLEGQKWRSKTAAPRPRR